eukprot:CAMPEP_0116837224 /NCGR_PEP_ID=MMETSP0418-20121206/8534_1 /TAXON_ID=1158023 /ORGANISM="Astrosyne radiata, Strain 13vi08-1A" /LENGTH=238 /DNA_ID=CAMNT_0004467083 /DNA_START=50 /DNA_END=766 /DNA_ORIENTATION=+
MNIVAHYDENHRWIQENEQDACQSDKDCLNGGTCRKADGVSSFSNDCLCKVRFAGPQCERECPLKCENGGWCRFHYSATESNHLGDASCQCSGMYTGSLCHIPFIKCLDKSACLNGGMCILKENSNSHYTCKCPKGFEGPSCSVDPVELASVPVNETSQDELNQQGPSVAEAVKEELVEDKKISIPLLLCIVGIFSLLFLSVRMARKKRGYKVRLDQIDRATAGAFDFQERQRDADLL